MCWSTVYSNRFVILSHRHCLYSSGKITENRTLTTYLADYFMSKYIYCIKNMIEGCHIFYDNSMVSVHSDGVQFKINYNGLVGD